MKYKKIINKLFAMENKIFSFILFFIALFYVKSVYNKLYEFKEFFQYNFSPYPIYSLLNDLIVIFYLTIASFILLFSLPPIKRDMKFTSLLVALLGSFSPYVLIFTPPSDTSIGNL